MEGGRKNFDCSRWAIGPSGAKTGGVLVPRRMGERAIVHKASGAVMQLNPRLRGRVLDRLERHALISRGRGMEWLIYRGGKFSREDDGQC